MKKYYVKFIGFYIIRKDYLRINPQNNRSQILSNPSTTNDTSYKKRSLSQFLSDYKKQLIQNLVTYHPFIGSIAGKIKSIKAMRIPPQIQIGFIITSLIVLITMIQAFSKITESICNQKRFAINNYYICGNSSLIKNQISQNSVAIAFGASVISVITQILVVFLFSRDYFTFLKKLAEQSQNFEQINSEKDYSDAKMVNLPTQQHHPTLQNMLNDDIEYTRRSLKAANNNYSKKDLFQINEAEDEEPFSPSKSYSNLPNPQSQVLGENKIILNTNNSIQKRSNKKNQDIIEEYDLENIHDPPQFCSYNKNIALEESILGNNDYPYQNTNSQPYFNHPITQLSKYTTNASRQQLNPNNSSKVFSNSGCGNSDVTTIMEGKKDIQVGLENIAEEDDLKKSQTFKYENEKHHLYQHEKCNSSNHLMQISQTSNQDIKEEDSSRISMLNHKPPQEIQKKNKNLKPNNETLSIITLLSLLIALIVLIISSLYILYTFYNMTESGLINILITLVIGIFFDFFIMRIFFISLVSIFTTIKEKKTQNSIKKVALDEEQINLLGSIYEDYEQQFFIPQENNHQLINSNIQDDEEKGNAKLKNQQNSQSPFKSERILRTQQTSKSKKLGEIVLVESTIFYHNNQISISDTLNLNNNSQLPLQTILKHSQTQDSKKKRQGEKVQFTKSISFNAEDIKLHKAHTEKLQLNEDDDSGNYDIEEIPMQSSRQNQQQEKSIQLPPIATQHHQFETPKGLNTRNPFAQLNISVNNNDNTLRSSQQDPKLMLRELMLQNSSSSQKKKGQEIEQYQSLRRYLEQDKENNSSAKNTNKKLSSMKKDSARQNMYLDNQQLSGLCSPQNNLLKLQPIQCQDEIINFTPQYSSVNKSKILQSQTLNNENRKSLALPQIYSDLKNISICSDLQKSKNNISSTKKNGKKNKENCGELFSDLKDHPNTSTYQKLASKKSFNSPGSIKENLGTKLSHQLMLSNKMSTIMQPNVSPFNDKQISQTFEIEDPRAIAEQSTFNIQQCMGDNNLLNSPPKISNFKIQQQQEGDKIMKNSNNANLKNILQPKINNINKKKKSNNLVQNLPQQTSIKENSISQEVNMKSQTLENTIDKKAKNLLNKKSKKNQIKQKSILEKKESIETQVINQENDSYTFDNSKTILNNQNTSDDDTVVKIEQIEQNNAYFNNNSRDETNRSKIFEDSDQSTYRMVNFSRQQSSKQLTDQNKDLMNSISSKGNIDFYSQSTQQIEKEYLKSNSNVYEYNVQEFKRSKKQSIAEIIVEENEIRNSLSPEKIIQYPNPVINTTDESIIESEDVSQIEDKQEVEDNYNIMKQMNKQTTLQNAISPTFANLDPNEMIICKRQQTQKSKGQQRSLDRNTNRSLNRSKQPSSYEYEGTTRQSHLNSDTNQIFKTQEDSRRKQKDDEEFLIFRIQEQKRKLKHFLKLARQLKSKDEKKIKELLAILKETKKPLPIQKINELKLLEIMSSPYNQSLIDMIKDEYDKHNKKPKQGSKKNSKSQSRPDPKNGQVIRRLSGIYGIYGQNAASSGVNTRTKSREGSADFANRPPRNKLSKKSNRQETMGSRQLTMQINDANFTNEKFMPDIIIVNQEYYDESENDDLNSKIFQKRSNVQSIQIEDDYNYNNDSFEKESGLKTFMDTQKIQNE